jgi:hypothetical protein
MDFPTLEAPYRFEKSRLVGACLGLVSARDPSGDRDPREKRISKEGIDGMRTKILLLGALLAVSGVAWE